MILFGGVGGFGYLMPGVVNTFIEEAEINAYQDTIFVSSADISNGYILLTYKPKKIMNATYDDGGGSGEDIHLNSEYTLVENKLYPSFAMSEGARFEVYYIY